MAKLLVLSGLPASGKSTYAEETVAQGNWVRLNRDLLRTMLHFKKWSGRHEGITVDCEKALTRALLTLGHNVVIDDCNLNPKNKETWSTIAKECGASFEHKHIDTSWEECVVRDIGREKKVGKHIILNMALQYGLYRPDLLKSTDQGITCVDIDGTLADCTHRLQYAKGDTKDWKKFFDGIPHDTLRTEVAERVDMCRQAGHPIILVSARPEDYRATTEQWLKDNGIEYETLIMRRSGDKRDDVDVKQDIYERYLKKYHIVTWFDDRPKVIRMLRNNGINVIDVGLGIEF